MTITDIKKAIVEKSRAFVFASGRDPTDICLGPQEFDVFATAARDNCIVAMTSDEARKAWQDFGMECAPFFYRGARIRAMIAPGIMVGCLTARTIL